MAEVDAAQLERVLGRPDWQTMSYGQLSAQAHSLETAAGFTRTLMRYMAETGTKTAGEAFAALAARNANEAHGS